MKKRVSGESVRSALLAVMRRRPLAVLCLGLVLAILLREGFGSTPIGEERLPTSVLTETEEADGVHARVEGKVQAWQIKEKTIQYVLENCSLEIRGRSCRLSALRVSVPRERENGRMRQDATQEEGSGAIEEHFSVGAMIRVTGELSRIEAAANPGQFDARAYYRTMGISYTMYAETAEILQQGGGAAERMALARAEMAALQSRHLGEEAAGVLAAITLGERALLTEESRTDYRVAGIFHVICISGLHISLLGMLLFQCLFRAGVFLAAKVGARRMPVISSRHKEYWLCERAVAGRLLFWIKAVAAVASLGGMALYCLFVGSPPSAIRALIMFGVMLGAKLCGRSYDLANALSLAAILILVPRPACLFHSGFQLSFVAVIGAGLLYPKAARRLRARRSDEKEEKRKGRRGLPGEVLQKCREGILLWLCVTAVSLPLVARYYYEVPVWGFLANLLLVPLVGIVLLSGLAGSAALFAACAAMPLCSTALAAIGRCLLLPAELLLRLFSLVSAFVRRLPFASWICGQPAWWQVGLYYALLLLAFLLACRRRPRVHFAWAGCLALFCLFWRPAPGFSLTMLDVGQGDCFVIRNGAAVFLMDGGSSGVSEVGRYRIIPYLKSRGIRRVDGIFVSHGDEDHISGIDELFQEIAEGRCAIRVETLLLPRWMRDDETGRQLAERAERAGAEIRYLQAGDAVFADALSFRVLAPEGRPDAGAQIDEGAASPAPPLSGNAASLVLHLEYEGFDVLLTGDLEGEGEEALLPCLPDVDLLKVAHHGSRNSTSAEFLARCRPEICLVSAPMGGRYGHPHRETLARLADAGADCYISKVCGAVRVTVGGGKACIERMFDV